MVRVRQGVDECALRQDSKNWERDSDRLHIADPGFEKMWSLNKFSALHGIFCQIFNN